MAEGVLQGLEILAKLLEIIGAVALIAGFVIGTAKWLRDAFQQEKAEAQEHYRRSLARTILIGLELLVVATIIKMITVEPTVEGMGLLVFMVVIRTVLGWATVLEKNGRWPWQRPRPAEAEEE